MNLYEQFNKLGKQQIAFQEGLDLLKENSASLKGISESMDVWGTIAVASNVALIPLNVIVNAFELGAVKDLYQVVVKQLYGKFAKSGTRLDGDPKVALSILKKAIIDLLKNKGLKNYIPGVNILVGLSEDSVALWQAIQVAEQGKRTIKEQGNSIRKTIESMQKHLTELGLQRERVLVEMQRRSRTA